MSMYNSAFDPPKKSNAAINLGRRSARIRRERMGEYEFHEFFRKIRAKRTAKQQKEKARRLKLKQKREAEKQRISSATTTQETLSA